jgi:hypothetical protein
MKQCDAVPAVERAADGDRSDNSVRLAPCGDREAEEEVGRPSREPSNGARRYELVSCAVPHPETVRSGDNYSFGDRRQLAIDGDCVMTT